MPTAEIRLATLADAPAVAVLCAQLGYPCSSAEMRARLTRVSLDAAHRVLVCPGSDPPIVGWIHAFERFTVESGASVEVAGLVVHADGRGQGVGRALILAVERWAVARECGNLRLGCNVVRLDAHRFYERLGFEFGKTQKIFRKTLGPAPTPQG